METAVLGASRTRFRPDLHASAQIRELFLSRATDDLSALRPVVARSWRRSRAAGVDASRDRGYIEGGRVDERTLQVAQPYLQELDAVAEDVGGYVSLTSPNGSLVKPSFLRDDVYFPPGYSLLESSCGSNGEGVALEEGRAVWLSPEEHFREDMRGNWCFASLIRDPFHNRVRAVVGLTLPSGHVSELEPASTLLMLQGVTARIERDIEDCMSSRERALLNEYLTVSRRRSTAAVLATDGKHSFMNAVATTSFEGGDLSVVTGYAKAVMASGRELSVEAMLDGPGPSAVDVAAVELPSSGYGAIAVVRPLTIGRPRLVASSPLRAIDARASIDPLTERLHGQSIAFQQAIASAHTAIENARSVIIVGEPGVGKRRLAEGIASARGVVIHLDGRNSDVGRLMEESRRTGASKPGPTFVIAHADEVSSVESRAVAAQLRTGDCNVILTAASITDGTRAVSDACGALEIPVPPLRRRREDVPLLAGAIAKEIGDRRLSRKLIATLMKADWPGNVSQLRRVVTDAASRAQGIEIGEADLPDGFHRMLTAGRLSRLEDVELAEIRNALREAVGNRRVAAEALEIGRSTLYRRMDYFRSRGFDL